MRQFFIGGCKGIFEYYFGKKPSFAEILPAAVTTALISAFSSSIVLRMRCSLAETLIAPTGSLMRFKMGAAMEPTPISNSSMTIA